MTAPVRLGDDDVMVHENAVGGAYSAQNREDLKQIWIAIGSIEGTGVVNDDGVHQLGVRRFA